MHKGKRALVGVALVLVVGGAGGYWAFTNAQAVQGEEVPVNQREYQVTKGDITVGIDGAGKIEVQPRVYQLPKEVGSPHSSLQKGDWVKKGEVLLTLTADQAEKHRTLLKEKREAVEEKEKALQEDREDYLNNMNWELENRRYNTENQYYEDLWHIENRIDTLAGELSEARWKRDFLRDDALTQATVTALEAELAEQEKERDARKERREKEEAAQENPQVQKKRQAEKLAQWDAQIAHCRKERKALQEQEQKARSAEIKAEKEGVVLEVNTQKGTPSTVKVGEKEDLRIHLSIEPEDIVDTKKGQAVEFFVDAYPDQIRKGKVEKRVLAPDSNGKFAVVVRLEGEKGDTELLPGMTAAGVLIVKQKKDVLTLPNKAIALREGKQYIKVKGAEGKLVEKEIKTGFSDGRLTEVLAGAAEGDNAVTEAAR